ncbi:MAG TPA: alpha/beta fold hydrolase, partial [Solirubrobacterales bacterium]|nr:alpha/beta fold hydrolase [Solirubrobacterales bacterium]
RAGWVGMNEDPPSTRLQVAELSFPLWVRSGGASPTRVVVLSHGLTNDHRDAPLFDDLRRTFMEGGDTVVVDFDYPGSGSADGELVDKRLSILRAALVGVFEFTREHVDDQLPIALVGRSIGGTVALSASPEVRPARLAVMSPPFELSTNLGALRGERSPDGSYPLPEWAQPSGQVKGEVALSSAFYDELEDEEKRLRESVRGARNVFLISSTEDPKVRSGEMDALWELLASDPTNQRAVLATDHNYNSVKGEVTRMLAEWLRR